ncbi:MAG: hypothetical protein AB1775_06255 [Bacteroidota bacterium]
MKELNALQMEEIEGGVKWACVGIAVVAVASTGLLGGLFFIAAGVTAGCFD